MGHDRTTGLRLEIDFESEPFEGILRGPSGLTVPFRGWLGLAAAIERAAASDRARPADDNGRSQCQ